MLKSILLPNSTLKFALFLIHFQAELFPKILILKGQRQFKSREMNEEIESTIDIWTMRQIMMFVFVKTSRPSIVIYWLLTIDM